MVGPAPTTDEMPDDRTRRMAQLRGEGRAASRWPRTLSLGAWLVLAVVVLGQSRIGAAERVPAGAMPDRLQRQAFSEDEIRAIWERRPVRGTAHRGYIFIDEEDIQDVQVLPIFRVEGTRFGSATRLQRLVGDDDGAAARLADLAPELARETEIRRREEGAFFTRRPGVASDVPQTPDVVFGPLLSMFSARR